MSDWTAIIPFNFGRPRKTRLSALLSVEERDALAMTMAGHVVAVLSTAPSLTEVHMVSPVDPGLPGTRWVEDEGGGLNAELERARDALAGKPVLFIHADLPLLTRDDVEILLTAAIRHGAAIAPAADGGTNALAIADGRGLSLAFGTDSLARHRAALPDAPLVERPGLFHDVDDEASLRAAIARGFVYAAPVSGATGSIAPSI